MSLYSFTETCSKLEHSYNLRNAVHSFFRLDSGHRSRVFSGIYFHCVNNGSWGGEAVRVLLFHGECCRTAEKFMFGGEIFEGVVEVVLEPFPLLAHDRLGPRGKLKKGGRIGEGKEESKGRLGGNVYVISERQ